MCITHSAGDTKCRIVSLLLSPAKLRSNEKNKKIYILYHLYSNTSKQIKSKHSNLFQKKNNQRKRANTKQKGYNVNPFQLFCGLQGAKNVYLVDCISAANKTDGFETNWRNFLQNGHFSHFSYFKYEGFSRAVF